MREILFRGKRIDNGEWVEGHLCNIGILGTTHLAIVPYEVSMYYDRIEGYCIVDPATVGQYTGLTDKNGKMIFEGDIITSWKRRVFAVKFGQYLDDEELFSGNGWYVSGEHGTLSFDERWGGHEVIGNIHDNPELLED